MEADIIAVDRGELVSLMEPMLVTGDSRHRAPITDLALELVQKSAGFRGSLPSTLVAPLANLVRAMNCYYSNLIEGHDTHPVDDSRWLKGDYSQDSRKRDLQFEANAHIAVQQWIDTGGLKGGQAIRAGKHIGNSPALLRAAARGSTLGRRPRNQRTPPRGARRIPKARRES